MFTEILRAKDILQNGSARNGWTLKILCKHYVIFSELCLCDGLRIFEKENIKIC